MLVRDDSPANWRKLAKKYSIEPEEEVLHGFSGEFSPKELTSAIVHSPKGEVVGPLDYAKGFAVLENAAIGPKHVQPLGEVRSAINYKLTYPRKKKRFSKFVRASQRKWTSRTVCVPSFVIVRCSNYKGSGR